MKFRTDFVTNSSSSSFIMTSPKTEDIQKAFQNKKAEIENDKWIEEGLYECLNDWLSCMEFEKMNTFEPEELYEVFWWYLDKFLEKVIGEVPDFYPLSGKERKAILQELEKREFSKEQLKRITSMFLIFVMEYIENKKEYPERYTIEHFTYSLLEENVSEYLWEERYWGFHNEEMVIACVLGHFTEVWELAKEFEGQHIGDILAYLFEAEYLYYNSSETHYLIGDTISESENCKYSCCHMG